MPLTPRERVLAALNHEQPDRVPIVIGAGNATGIRMEAYRRLKARLGVRSPDRWLYDWPELGTAELEEVVLDRLHSDVRGVFDRLPMPPPVEGSGPRFDDWGVGRTEISPGEWFPTIHPLAEAETIDRLESYPWPDMLDPRRTEAAVEQARRLRQENRYAVMLTPWLLFPLERAFALQGMDRFLINLALKPDFAEALLHKTAEMCRRLMGSLLQAVGSWIDIVKIGDDLGTQDRLLISPAMYRRRLKPIHAEFIAFIKSLTRAKVLFHSDGDVFDLIDDFIEIGVDVLNPVQTSAGRMSDLSALKRRYGKNICFCGAVDTQRILPRGTTEEVRAEVRRVMDHLAPGGGYLLSAVHTIMNEVPPENILAMVDAALEYGRYPPGCPGR